MAVPFAEMRLVTTCTTATNTDTVVVLFLWPLASARSVVGSLVFMTMPYIGCIIQWFISCQPGVRRVYQTSITITTNNRKTGTTFNQRVQGLMDGQMTGQIDGRIEATTEGQWTRQ